MSWDTICIDCCSAFLEYDTHMQVRLYEDLLQLMIQVNCIALAADTVLNNNVNSLLNNLKVKF